jgi:hypothetical protein
MMADTVRSKPWLGLLGNLSAIMATMAAFGAAMYMGIQFIGINLAAPFLMIGKSQLKLKLHEISVELPSSKKSEKFHPIVNCESQAVIIIITICENLFIFYFI